MDVGGAQLDRALDDQVDQADDRRLGREVAQVLDVVHVAGVSPSAVLDDRAHRAAALAVPALDQVVDLRTQADAAARTVAAGRQAHRVERRSTSCGSAIEHVDAGRRSRRSGTTWNLLHELRRERHAFGRQLRARPCALTSGRPSTSARGFGVVALGHQAQARQQRRAGCRRSPPAGGARGRGRRPSAGPGPAARRDAFVRPPGDLVGDCVHDTAPFQQAPTLAAWPGRFATCRTGIAGFQPPLRSSVRRAEPARRPFGLRAGCGQADADY